MTQNQIDLSLSKSTEKDSKNSLYTSKGTASSISLFAGFCRVILRHGQK